MKAERVELEPRTILGVHEVIPMTAMTDFFGRALTTAFAEVGKQGVAPAGPRSRCTTACRPTRST